MIPQQGAEQRKRITKILIANRGEIAVRIIRTCRERGIRSVAVYSEVDRRAPHVALADEAYPLGPATLRETYLHAEKIIRTAVRAGADAVHPGYGFLSENPRFAEACRQAGLIFIGPPPEAIRSMGDKTAARALAAEAGIPMAAGTTGAVADADEAREVADRIGYPVLIKAAAGGGGKGMRVVEKPGDLDRSLDMARSEARASFGDDRVFVEKYIAEPRHVEVQILADHHGNAVHLYERECSVQRRHQKVIEEAPSPVVTPEVRRRMGEAAIRAARACGYRNAGTVEFLVDRDLNFYFMEMNTRLQVEHPITEWITGRDLVAEQIRIAEGEPLGYAQEDVTALGHAVECRIYAEDVYNHFLPDPGNILHYRAPSGFGVRVDSGVETGSEIFMHYDAMIAKLSAWGRTREEAIRRMSRALSEFEIAGLHTTIPFCRFAMEHEAFRSGRYTTHFIAEHFRPERDLPLDGWMEPAALAAALCEATAPEAPTREIPAGIEPAGTAWRRRKRFDG